MDENKKPNHCIACTVTECEHHAKSCNYCSLDKINVGTHESNPQMVECTDCESFRPEGKQTGSAGAYGVKDSMTEGGVS